MNRVGSTIKVEGCYARQVRNSVYLAIKPRGKAWASATLYFDKGTCRWGKLRTRTEAAAKSWVDAAVANDHPRDRSYIDLKKIG